MVKGFVWLSLNIVVLSVAGLSRSDVWIARGSDSLVSLYRVPLPGLLAALGLFVVLTAYLALVFRPLRGAGFFTRTILLGTLAVVPLWLSLRSLSLSATSHAVELTEYVGPWRTRSVRAAWSEARLPMDCGPTSLLVASDPDGPKRFWLGIGPWTISGEVCRHPLVEPVSPGR